MKIRGRTVIYHTYIIEPTFHTLYIEELTHGEVLNYVSTIHKGQFQRSRKHNI